MKVALVGLGLIGGSFALDLKKHRLCDTIVGVDNDSKHRAEAVRLGIVDETASLEEAVCDANLVVVAIPVNHIEATLRTVLDCIKPSQFVIDMGSTKESIVKAVVNHPNRSSYVACHPIAGTENTGPSAAFSGLFQGKVNIICNEQHSSKEALDFVLSVFQELGMKTIFMDSKEHDRHIAYVSHLSHVSSFALGKTVLEIEKSEKNIFNMAGSGFASTVRLAKSSPDMWTPIFDQNAKNISKALGTYIENLKELKAYIDQHNTTELHELMKNTNEIKRVLTGIELRN